MVAGIFEVTVSTAARMATLGFSRPREMARSMAFWQMSTLSSKRGSNIDRAVGNDQHLVISGNIHDKHMADAAPGAQSAFAGDDRRHQLVGMQAAFHQEFGLSLAQQFHSLRRRRVAVRGIHNLKLAEDRFLQTWRLLRSFGEARPGWAR